MREKQHERWLKPPLSINPYVEGGSENKVSCGAACTDGAQIAQDQKDSVKRNLEWVRTGVCARWGLSATLVRQRKEMCLCNAWMEEERGQIWRAGAMKGTGGEVGWMKSRGSQQAQLFYKLRSEQLTGFWLLHGILSPPSRREKRGGGRGSDPNPITVEHPALQEDISKPRCRTRTARLSNAQKSYELWESFRHKKRRQEKVIPVRL